MNPGVLKALERAQAISAQLKLQQTAAPAPLTPAPVASAAPAMSYPTNGMLPIHYQLQQQQMQQQFLFQQPQQQTQQQANVAREVAAARERIVAALAAGTKPNATSSSAGATPPLYPWGKGAHDTASAGGSDSSSDGELLNKLTANGLRKSGYAGGPIMSEREASGVKYGLHRANFKAPGEVVVIKLLLGIELELSNRMNFPLLQRLVGPNGSFLTHIQVSSPGVSVSIHGKGVIPDSVDPLQLRITGSDTTALDKAKALCDNLVATVRSDYDSHTRPVTSTNTATAAAAGGASLYASAQPSTAATATPTALPFNPYSIPVSESKSDSAAGTSDRDAKSSVDRKRRGDDGDSDDDAAPTATPNNKRERESELDEMLNGSAANKRRRRNETTRTADTASTKSAAAAYDPLSADQASDSSDE